jgi:hypothetical protein
VSLQETGACLDALFSLLKTERKAVIAFDVVAINDSVDAIEKRLDELKVLLAKVKSANLVDAPLVERMRELKLLLSRNDRLIRFAQSLTQLVARRQSGEIGVYDQNGGKVAASESRFSRSV